MNFLTLKPLTVDLLPAVVELDRRCLGGLWSIEGYRRELESPNSDLLVLEVLQQEAIDRVNSEVDASPPSSAELPSHHSSATGEACKNVRSTPLTQSSPFMGDLGGNAGLPAVEELGGNAGLPEIGDLEGNAETSPTIQPSQPSSGSLIGLGCLWAIAEEAHITILAIDPDYRQHGLGQAILFALLVSAHDRGLEWATLEVRASNAAAIRLHEKFGFGSVGRRKGYYSDGEDALILWRSGLQKPEFRLWMQETERQIADRLQESNYKISLKPVLQTAFT